MMRTILFVAAAIASLPAVGADWTTPAERARYASTPDYAETTAWLQRLAAASPDTLRILRFGRTPEGRDIDVVVAASAGEFTPDAARESGKEIVFVQAGIHAGEIEGKDAGLLLLRDLATAPRHRHLLDHAIVLYLPVFNVDGHERRSPDHRVNQNGPTPVGTRGTSQNLNLNRDYVKADAPEMQAWLAFWNAWQPDLLVDIHTTDGADYQYDLTWYTEDWGNLHPAVKAWNDTALRGRIFPRTEKRGHLLAPYLDLVDHRDIRKGIGNFGSGPRYSTGYAAIRNRAALLVETHMLKSYETRVAVTHDLLLEILGDIDRHPGELRRATITADADAATLGAREGTVPLTFKTSETAVPFMLKGYEFSQSTSDISNDTWVRYDPKRRRTYEVPFYRDLLVAESVTAPAAYLVPRAWTGVIDKLVQHGVRIERVGTATDIRAQQYRLEQPRWATRPFEGRITLDEFGAKLAAVDARAEVGDVLVALDRPESLVALHLLEPRAPDSLLRWGWFNIVFEQREYADARVAERIARELLAQKPELRAEFDAALKDPAFAKDPAARLDFFFRRSRWRDETLDLYPVLRLDADALKNLREGR